MVTEYGFPETAGEARRLGWEFEKILPDHNFRELERIDTLRNEGYEIARFYFTQNGRPTSKNQYALWKRYQETS